MFLSSELVSNNGMKHDTGLQPQQLPSCFVNCLPFHCLDGCSCVWSPLSLWSPSPLKIFTIICQKKTCSVTKCSSHGFLKGGLWRYSSIFHHCFKFFFTHYISLSWVIQHDIMVQAPPQLLRNTDQTTAISVPMSWGGITLSTGKQPCMERDRGTTQSPW